MNDNFYIKLKTYWNKWCHKLLMLFGILNTYLFLFAKKALHFSPALYNYIVKEEGKQLILVLNKVDLAPPALVVAWKHYFCSKFPLLHIVCFTSFPKDEQEGAAINTDPGQSNEMLYYL